MLQALRAFANQAMSAVESARQLELMRHLAEHDPLTGLRNRRGLQEHIDAEIAARRARSRCSSCDLDNFKRVNDALGYVQGDEALRRFAGVLGARPAGLAARLGGEEFALVLPGCGEDEAMAVAERLRARRPPPRSPTSRGRSPTSAGVAVSGRGRRDARRCCCAPPTRAVFGAKRLGRDRCVVYHAEALDDAARLARGRRRGGEQLAAAMLLAETLDLRDVGTARHSADRRPLRRGDRPRARAAARSRVQRIRAAGVLHDIGKLGVADAILQEAGRARPTTSGPRCAATRSSARASSTTRTCATSAAGCSPTTSASTAAATRDGLAGEAIPLEARILAVADAYEAMTADRPYRAAMRPRRRRDELRACAGTQFDPVVVDAFLRALAPKARRAAAAVPHRLV